ncbi:DUF3311 domain-containing protein [Halorarius halobius]|uniref:DUF3311 domain-containing protein n=1 Tax=Halorarius halobius TaxID=2962671 RepID=UPI0020CBEDBA|nr:DUF3311 domain-containing protein [Halorarius halobius]
MADADAVPTEGARASRVETFLWAAVLLTVAALSVPWFLWRSSAVAFGLPVWLWWHIGWMGVAAVTFYAFGKRAWGLGIEPSDASNRASGDEVEP